MVDAYSEWYVLHRVLPVVHPAQSLQLRIGRTVVKIPRSEIWVLFCMLVSLQQQQQRNIYYTWPIKTIGFKRTPSKHLLKKSRVNTVSSHWTTRLAKKVNIRFHLDYSENQLLMRRMDSMSWDNQHNPFLLDVSLIDHRNSKCPTKLKTFYLHMHFFFFYIM